MIVDLHNSDNTTEDCDVLVIGGGTAGLLLTAQLHEKGHKVVCVESGGYAQATETHELNTVIQRGSTYEGAALGRFRCLGGTSTRWGGAMIPFLDIDLEQGEWPIGMNNLKEFIPRLEKIFNLFDGSFDGSSFSCQNKNFITREAKWPPFKKRNVYRLFKGLLNAKNGPRVYINATVTHFNVSSESLDVVSAQAKNGIKLIIKAKKIIIASGCIESTRLLLLLNKQNPSSGSIKSSSLGEGFHDHLSCVVADLEVKDRKKLNRLVGLEFSKNGGMKNIRFEMNSNSEFRKIIPPCFFHVSFDQSNGQFYALRAILRSLQKMSFPAINDVLTLLKGLPWLVKALYWKVCMP